MKIVAFLFLFFLCQLRSDAQVINLGGNWKFHIGDNSAWATPEYDDSEWELIETPSAWEDQGFNGYDGFAWYRITFNGQRLSKNDNYYLNLGYIDDSDEAYVNGRLVGFSGSMPPKFKTAYNSERKYPLPNDIIDFRGENTIAIRVFDVTLGGGIIDGKIGIYRAPKSRMLVDLEGLWDFSVSRSGEQTRNNNNWTKIMAPGPWEYQGFQKYDGFAWYKKTFTIDANLLASGEELVLILGRIDDFDITYLNGKVIGQTKDDRGFGRSMSFSRLRAYSIPTGLIKKGLDNYIEVLVEDIGNIGGIYEGPLGITTRTNYERYYR